MMKKYILTIALLLISYLGFSQITPSGDYRIADRTTAFGINIPVGTQIYCVSDFTTWKVTAALPSSATITTGLSSLFLVGTTNLSVGTKTGTTVIVNSSTGASVTLPSATATEAGLMTAAENAKLAAISGTNTGDQTTITGNAGTATALATARTINGVAFDGTGNITITAVADAATLTGATLAPDVLASSLTSVGTLTGLTVTAPIAGSVTGSAAIVTAAAQPAITSVGTLIGLTVIAPIAGSITGNAATATKLAATKNINGVAFDGTSDITITAVADANTLTGTTLAPNVLASSLTSVGTLTGLTVTAPIAGSITGNAATVTTNANLTGDVTSSGNATTIANNAVTYAKMQAMTANKLLGSGALGTAVTEITLGTGLSYSGSTLNTTGVGSRYIVESFEEAVAGSSTNRKYSLINAPATATGLTVQLNGMPLTVTNQYTLTGLVVAVIIPVYQYDRLTVSYTY